MSIYVSRFGRGSGGGCTMAQFIELVLRSQWKGQGMDTDLQEESYVGSRMCRWWTAK